MNHKVILLAPTPPPFGGIAIWTTRMLQARMPGGWAIDVVDEKVIGKRAKNDNFDKKNRRNLFTEIKRCFAIWNRLKKKVRDDDVKVVHSCIASTAFSMMREYVCARITKKKRKKFIIHFRCTIPTTIGGVFSKILLKKICKISDSIIVLNKKSADYLQSFTETRIELIPNFVSVSEIADHKQINPRLREIVYVGNVIESKGCLDLIKLAERFPDIVFKMIGKYNESMFDTLHVPTNVVLTGALDHARVSEELDHADVFAFLSFYNGEGFSNALVEAMAKGLPCLVTDWAANRDMIEDQGGIVIPIHDLDAAAKGVDALRDETFRKKASAFNISKVTYEYSEEVILNKYVSCYERCMGEKHEQV